YTTLFRSFFKQPHSEDDAYGAVLAHPLLVELGTTVANAPAGFAAAHEGVAITTDVGRYRLRARAINGEVGLDVPLSVRDPHQAHVGDQASRARNRILAMGVPADEARHAPRRRDPGSL